MSTFTWPPSWGARMTVKPAVLEARFGDGYQQRVGDGINAMPRSWSVSFSQPIQVIDEIEDFLRAAHGVSAFNWTPPRGGAGLFICQQWDRGDQSPSVNTLSATFVEVFEP